MVYGCTNNALLAVAIAIALLIHGEVLCSDLRKGRSHDFDENYEVTWGNDHVSRHGSRVNLSLDYCSGSGFKSKLKYGSGFFHLRIKLPAKNSGGVVTAFYLQSDGSNHDELDFEFLGNKEGKPITLQTNVFAHGVGGREQRLVLWFDPTAEFHNYEILWNPYQIVFYVDKIPIRVFKNYTKIGVEYPSQPMQVMTSIWNGEGWATDGGKTKVDWSNAPFIAEFEGSVLDGCATTTATTTTSAGGAQDCGDPGKYWWNGEKFRALSSKEKGEYEIVRKKYVNYDYCNDRSRFPVVPPECLGNQ